MPLPFFSSGCGLSKPLDSPGRELIWVPFLDDSLQKRSSLTFPTFWSSKTLPGGLGQQSKGLGETLGGPQGAP